MRKHEIEIHNAELKVADYGISVDQERIESTLFEGIPNGTYRVNISLTVEELQSGHVNQISMWEEENNE